MPIKSKIITPLSIGNPGGGGGGIGGGNVGIKIIFIKFFNYA